MYVKRKVAHVHMYVLMASDLDVHCALHCSIAVSCGQLIPHISHDCTYMYLLTSWFPAITRALTYIHVRGLLPLLYTSCPSAFIHTFIHTFKNQYAYQPHLRSIFARNKQSRNSRDLESSERSWADSRWPRSCPEQISEHKQWRRNFGLRSSHVSRT